MIRDFYIGYATYNRAPTIPTYTPVYAFETRTPTTSAPIYYLALTLVTETEFPLSKPHLPTDGFKTGSDALDNL